MPMELHMPLAMPREALDVDLAPAGAASRARRTRKASRRSEVVYAIEVVPEHGLWSVESAGVLEAGGFGLGSGELGGTRSQTTHQPRDVLQLRSISVPLRDCRVLARVARTWVCTLRASSLLQPAPSAVLLDKPSAMSVPGSGMLGRLECTVSVRGSQTRS